MAGSPPSAAPVPRRRTARSLRLLRESRSSAGNPAEGSCCSQAQPVAKRARSAAADRPARWPRSTGPRRRRDGMEHHPVAVGLGAERAVASCRAEVLDQPEAASRPAASPASAAASRHWTAFTRWGRPSADQPSRRGLPTSPKIGSSPAAGRRGRSIPASSSPTRGAGAPLPGRRRSGRRRSSPGRSCRGVAVPSRPGLQLAPGRDGRPAIRRRSASPQLLRIRVAASGEIGEGVAGDLGVLEGPAPVFSSTQA